MRCLKKKFVYKDEKFFVYPDGRYFSEIVKVQIRKSKNTPAPTEVQHENRSEELETKKQSLYRSAVGWEPKLLFRISGKCSWDFYSA